MTSVQEQLSTLRVAIAQKRDEFGAATTSLVWLPGLGLPFEFGSDPKDEQSSNIKRVNYFPSHKLRHPPHSCLSKAKSTTGGIFLDPCDSELIALTNDELRSACRLFEGTPKDDSYRVLPRTEVRAKVDRLRGAMEALSTFARELGRIYFRRNRVHCEETLAQIIVPTVFDAGPADWAFAWMFEKAFATGTKRPDLGVVLPNAFRCFIECVDELLAETATAKTRSLPVDGPIGRDGFRFNGREVFGLAPDWLAVLKFVWEERESPPTLGDVMILVNEVNRDRFDKLLDRIRKKLRADKWPETLEVFNGCVMLREPVRQQKAKRKNGPAKPTMANRSKPSRSAKPATPELKKKIATRRNSRGGMK